MKATCPGCATTFRVTPEQLAARAGKVRCGKCQVIFNAGEQLVTKEAPPLIDRSLDALQAVVTVAPASLPEQSVETVPALAFSVSEETASAPAVSSTDVTDTATQEAILAAELVLPRDTSEIPGYSKWTENPLDNHRHASFSNKPARWPFVLVAVVLGVVLAGQMAFHFRSQAAVAAPAFRPFLETLSDMLSADIPLPRRAELISIETSDLQADPKRADLLALQATLRNRATHEQAYPALQLSITDTLDSVIARRVFSPGEYLSPKDLTPLVFAANGEISVRLWIEAKDLTAAGYRLYAFYP